MHSFVWIKRHFAVSVLDSLASFIHFLSSTAEHSKTDFTAKVSFLLGFICLIMIPTTPKPTAKAPQATAPQTTTPQTTAAKVTAAPNGAEQNNGSSEGVTASDVKPVVAPVSAPVESGEVKGSKGSPVGPVNDVEKAVLVNPELVDADEDRDCFGVVKNGARVYLYAGIFACILLLLSVITGVSVAVSSPSSSSNNVVAPPINPKNETTSPTITTTLPPSSAPSASIRNTTSPTANPTELSALASLSASKPNIVVVMLDDLGYHDVGYTTHEPRERILDATPVITQLAKEEGIVLTRMYAHWHCSPSRRSFLTGE